MALPLWLVCNRTTGELLYMFRDRLASDAGDLRTHVRLCVWNHARRQLLFFEFTGRMPWALR